jgi:hypothetical protein
MSPLPHFQAQLLQLGHQLYLFAGICKNPLYWLITHPVNKFWLKETRLEGVAGGFFSLDPMKKGTASEGGGSEGWRRLRDKWEYSHVVRAVLSIIALIALIVAFAI